MIESTAPAWLVIAAFEADYNMNRADDFCFNVPIADAFLPPRGSSLARVPAELPPAAAGKNALMPDDFCFSTYRSCTPPLR